MTPKKMSTECFFISFFLLLRKCNVWLWYAYCGAHCVWLTVYRCNHAPGCVYSSIYIFINRMIMHIIIIIQLAAFWRRKKIYLIILKYACVRLSDFLMCSRSASDFHWDETVFQWFCKVYRFALNLDRFTTLMCLDFFVQSQSTY